jgi:hypothetical protein
VLLHKDSSVGFVTEHGEIRKHENEIHERCLPDRELRENRETVLLKETVQDRWKRRARVTTGNTFPT